MSNDTRVLIYFGACLLLELFVRWIFRSATDYEDEEINED